jgi:colicin import membrane protein
MKPILALALALSAAFSAQAQDDAAERRRIEAERTAVEARFAERRRECNAKFAVNDCVELAARDKNAALADLRRQERVLNDADRKRRAAERLRDQEERNSPERQRAEQERRARAIQDQKDREERAAEKKARRAADEAGRPKHPRTPGAASGPPQPQGSARAPQQPRSPPVSAGEAAKNRAAHEARLREAEEHKAEVENRIARRSKPAASALPVPK